MIWLLGQIWFLFVLGVVLGWVLSLWLASRPALPSGEDMTAALAAARTRHRESEADRGRLTARVAELEKAAIETNKTHESEIAALKAQGSDSTAPASSEAEMMVGALDAAPLAGVEVEALQERIRELEVEVERRSEDAANYLKDAQSLGARVRGLERQLEQARAATVEGDAPNGRSKAPEPATHTIQPPLSGQHEPAGHPADGGADDLKRIKGIGPKLEQTLNQLGIYYFRQIADWSDQQIDEVDAQLTFKGRINRDDWRSQAQGLSGE